MYYVNFKIVEKLNNRFNILTSFALRLTFDLKFIIQKIIFKYKNRNVFNFKLKNKKNALNCVSAISSTADLYLFVLFLIILYLYVNSIHVHLLYFLEYFHTFYLFFLAQVTFFLFHVYLILQL